MTKIQWRFVAAFLVGLLFLLSFRQALDGYAQLTDRDEDFLYVYEDPQMRAEIAEQSFRYDITCEETGQSQGAGVVTVSDADTMGYSKISNYFRANDGKIEVDLFKFLLRFAMDCFVAGTVLLLLLRAARERKIGDGTPIRHWLTVAGILLAWLLYLRIIPGKLQFPVWALPYKWSDFEGWQQLGASLSNQLFTMTAYRQLPEVEQYRSAVYTVLGCLPLSFLLLLCFQGLCRKIQNTNSLYILLTVSALLFYITGGNPQGKALIFFFPCVLLSNYLTAQQPEESGGI